MYSKEPGRQRDRLVGCCCGIFESVVDQIEDNLKESVAVERDRRQALFDVELQREALLGGVWADDVERLA